MNTTYSPDEILTVDDVAKELNVSSKTISRWRKQGLQSRYEMIASRKRVVITRRWLDEFITAHKIQVERGVRFSQMTDSQRDEIIQRAKMMAAVGNNFTEVLRRLSQNTGRSTETIRYTLKKYDKEHPLDAIFPENQPAMDEARKQEIFQAYRNGEPVTSLAERFQRTKTSIYRVLSETRARRVMEFSLDYIPCPEFEEISQNSGMELQILGEMPEGEYRTRKSKLPGGLPSYLASLYTVPLLTFNQEQHLFRKMNYLKYKASVLRNQLDPLHPSSRVMDQIENHYDIITEVKNQIVSANLRLVVSIAKRHTGPIDGLFDLISDGNMSLIRACEKFDYSRGNRFSTYASWAIMKNYARAIADEQRYRKRFMTLENEFNEEHEQEEVDPVEMETTQTRREKQVATILQALSPREQQIIIHRFGLNRDREPLTLKQVGQEMGVTKERIRQIEILALNKLRKAAEK